MGKNVGLTYGEFSFPSEQGFTGSAGKESVKGYQRGGRVRKMAEGGKFGKPGDKYPKLKSGPTGKRSAMPKNVKMKGGEVHAQMGGYMGAEREISVDDVKITVPKNRGGKMSMHDKAYAEGGKMGYNRGGHHDEMYKHGGKMGYAYGGKVTESNTSGQFKQTRGKQASMDTGVQPARKGRNEQEVEAGGTKRLKPGYGHGGGVHRVRDRTRGKGKSKKGFPASVKARGGLARYARGS